MGDGINFPCKYIYKQAGFAEPNSSLTISWVGVGLGWVRVGVGVGVGLGLGLVWG